MVNKIRNGVVWIRTPKCGTTTIAEHLEKFCNWKGMKYTSEYEHSNVAPINYFNLGHLWAGDVNWEVIKIEQRGVMASIRNPLDRFLSHYKHHLMEGRYLQYGNDVSSFYLENYDKENFESSFRGLDNYLCKYLSVGDDIKWDSSLLKKRYDYFTVSEHLQQSLNKFEKLTGYSVPNKELVKNKTEYKLVLNDNFLKLFNDRNKNDFELYNYVLENYGYEK